MKAIFTAVVLLLVCAFGADADEADRLVDDFNHSDGNVAKANKFFEFLDREQFTDSRIVFSPAVPTDSVRQQTWYWAAEWYCDQQDYARAKDYAMKALALMRWNNSAKSDCLNLAGIISVRLGDFKEAARYAQQCVDIDMLLGDADKTSSSLNTLAGTYMAADQPKEAEKYILMALDYAGRADNQPRRAILLGMASEIYYKLKDYRKAVDYADKAYRLDSIGGRQAKMAIRLSQKATALMGMEKFKDAELTFLKAIVGLRESGNIHSLAIDLNQLGFLTLRQKRHREAVGYFRQAAALFDKMGDLYNLVNSHKGLYESYWSLNPDSAKIELDRFNLLRDSLYSTATADALARYKTEFDTDRLQEEVQSSHSAHRRDIIVSVCAFAAAALLFIGFYRRKMRRQRAEMQRLVQEIEQLGSRAPEENPEEEPKNAFERMVVEAVLDGIDNGKGISVSAIASRLNLGEQTFRRRFVAETGKQPKTFVTAIQMEKAARMLKADAAVQIAEVARACGFDDASAFSHAFKKTFSCSPTQFRQKCG